MLSFNKFRHQFISLTVLFLLFLQILTISLSVVYKNEQLTESADQKDRIPRLLSEEELELSSKIPSLITPAYNGPPSLEGNIEVTSITITSNSEFSTVATSNGWTGTGDQYDPYLISNINFTSGDSEYRLKIQDTTSHFIIKNCVFVDADNLSILMNVQNGVIKESFFDGAIEYGLYVDSNCQGIRVIHNAFTNNATGGINVYNGNSSSNNFRYNYFDDHIPLNPAFGGLYWTDTYDLNGTGTDLTPREHTKFFNVDEFIIGSDPQLDTKAYELGWEGNGTIADPYIITNYNLSFAMETPLIDIQGTSSYILIKNCYINGNSLITGIYLYGVSNIHFINTTLERCDIGFLIYESNNINITKTDIIESSGAGIGVFSTQILKMSDSTINNSGTNAFYSNNLNNSFFFNI